MSWNQKKRGGGNFHNRSSGHKGGGGGASWRARLEVGQRGFLCTCNSFEKECVKEAMNLLNEYADKLFGPDDWRKNESAPKTDIPPVDNSKEDEEEEGSEEDVSKSLQKEVQSLKQESKRPIHLQRFRAVDSGAKNVIFISSNVPDPVLLGHTLLTDLKTSKVGRSRFLQRLLPVEVTCKAYLEDMTRAAGPLFDKHFAKGNTSFSIVYKCRNNKLNRDAVIKELADLVCLKNASNHANLTQPQLVVLVEIIRNVCCISVLSDYYELAKYNLLEVIAPPKAEKQESQTDGADGSVDEEPEEVPASEEANDADASPAKQAKEM
ncbi:THUMP domain-containing protein 1 [Cloeon dipterum]|uniref:THUMP domain-containing protein 1 n=1 Tax=Cloeon dipterum TaxID=197152 RepID=UPI0032205FC8